MNVLSRHMVWIFLRLPSPARHRHYQVQEDRE
jgi:hypothetical protein